MLVFKLALIVALVEATLAFSPNRTQRSNEKIEPTKEIGMKEIQGFIKLIGHLMPNGHLKHNETVVPAVKIQKATKSDDDDEPRPLLFATFGGIFSVALFLFVFYSGWCCEIQRLNRRQRSQNNSNGSTPSSITLQSLSRPQEPEPVPETTPAPPAIPQSPPPPYHLFAPPSYDEVISGRVPCPVLIVPVHNRTPSTIARRW